MSTIMAGADLLPRTYGLKRRQNRTVSLVALLGIGLLALVVLWWVSLGSKVNSEEQRLAEVKALNAGLQAESAELQEFAALETEVIAKTGALQTVMAGDIYWPTVLTQVSALIPDQVWITTLTGSAGTTEGATPVGTEAAVVRIAEEPPTGRIQFAGQATSMEAVAEWIEQLDSSDAFGSIWLNSATAPVGTTGDVQTFQFDSTLELGADALSQRYQGPL